MCQRWAEYGHRDGWASSGARPRTGQRTTAEKQDMRRVRANNERWRAALPVRRKFLRDLLARKTPPKRAVHQLLTAFAECAASVSPDSNRFACTLLGLRQPKYGQRHPITSKSKRATADQALIMTVGVMLAAFELAYDSTHKVNTWRYPTDEDRLYFAMLKDWGYTLSKVEQLVLDPEADVRDWPHLRAHDATAAPAPASEDLDDDFDDEFGLDGENADDVEDQPDHPEVDLGAHEDIAIAA